MIAINGIYNGEKIELLSPVPKDKKYKVIVTFIEEISTKEQQSIRDFGENSDGFDFWLNEKEDLYQDFLVGAK